MTPTAVLEGYFRAKDENRPRLMTAVFADDAVLEMVVRTGAISFPPMTRGLAAISDVLVRKFGQTYDNVTSFYLDRPADVAHEFSCDWVVGMTEKASGSVRVGCGRYDWRFRAQEPGLAERLCITVDVMQVLAPARADAVFTWLDALPRPWCDPRRLVATAPAMDELGPVLDRLSGGH